VDCNVELLVQFIVQVLFEILAESVLKVMFRVVTSSGEPERPVGCRDALMLCGRLCLGRPTWREMAHWPRLLWVSLALGTASVVLALGRVKEDDRQPPSSSALTEIRQ